MLLNELKDKDSEVAEFFHLFADRQRLQILRMLADGKEMSVTEIGEHLHQTQPAVSHHLSMLKDSGIIEFRRDGRFNRYSLSKSGLANAIEKFVGPIGMHDAPMTIPFAGLEIVLKRIV